MAYDPAELEAAAREGAATLRDVAGLVRSESFTMTADRMENAATRLEAALPPPEPTLEQLERAVVDASLAHFKMSVHTHSHDEYHESLTAWGAASRALAARIEKERGDA